MISRFADFATLVLVSIVFAISVTTGLVADSWRA